MMCTYCTQTSFRVDTMYNKCAACMSQIILWRCPARFSCVLQALYIRQTLHTPLASFPTV